MTIRFVRMIQILASVLVFGSFSAHAQVTANFTANITSGCSPVVVRFSDQSTGNISSWNWKFGNGSTSSSQNPGKIYITPGKYTVELTVSDGVNTDVIVMNDFIEVFEDPEINISASQIKGCTPLSVDFTDESNPGSSPLHKWTWNFGDGGTSTQQNPTYVYQNAGIYNVTLVAENQDGCKSDSVFSQFIEVEALPEADFTSDVQSSCQEPLTVNFTQQATNAITYFWDFGDGNTSNQANPSHTYTNSGVYDVTFTATNSSGCSDVLSIPGYIAIEQLQADFSASSTFACAGKAIQFTDLSSSNPDTWLWEFGDGNTSTDENPVHAYQTPGTYNVKLTASNSATCWDITEKTGYINVTNAPTADFSANNPSACTAPHTVNFNDLSVNANSWEWDFGDGTTSTDQNPSHTYTTEGQYDITLSVGSLNGCRDTLILEDYVSVESPEASFIADQTSGCVPMTSNFTDQSISTEPINQYIWDFGDGNTSTQPNPAHTYTAQGIYDVSLIVRNARGCRDTLLMTQFASAGEKPDADFAYSPTVSCKSDPINFTNLTTPNSNDWYWEFGDEGHSSEQNPSYVYSDTGTFSVVLIASMYGCADTQAYQNIVTIHPPGAGFTFDRTCDDTYEISFTDASLAAQTWEWDFGDGNTSTDRNPTHRFDSTGVYSVSLTVTDSVYGCMDIAVEDIRIYDTKADFTSADTLVCNPYLVQLKNLSVDGDKYKWQIEQGTRTSSLVDPAFTFHEPGYYDISLISEDVNGCADTLLKEDFIFVRGPLANFGATPTTGCAPLNVVFIDSSVGFGGAVNQFKWYFGDGDSSQVQNPSHVYKNSLIQDVTLMIEDVNGCTDTIVKSQLIKPSLPIANFSADELTCTGKAVSFTDSSEGNGLSYYWEFGDGNTDTIQNPEHEYEFEGTYTITLTVTDQFGCDSTLVKTDYVTVSDPVADFYADSLFSPCPPLLVHFTDSSKGNITAWDWDFGDGSKSQINEPSNVYNQPGSFSVELIVTNIVGCKDTLKKEDLVIVNGPNGTFSFTPKDGCLGNEIEFTAQTINSVENTWDFGDGTLFTGGDTATHTYPNSGIYNPVLVLDDGQGCLFTISSSDTLMVGDIQADFIADSNYLCKSGSIQFGDLSTGFPNITNRHWDFGDGNTSTAQNPLHHYNSSGVYTVELIVSNDYCSDTMRKEAFIRVDRGPQAEFSNAGLKCISADITFTDLTQSDSTLAKWSWDFGNGLTDSTQNTVTQYPDSGTYDVQLIVTSVSGCRDTVSNAITINELPIANAGQDSSICSYEQTQLNGQGGITYNWTPAAGLSNSNIANPVAQPDSTTNYILTVTDKKGCSNTDSVNIEVNYPPQTNTSSDTVLCYGEIAEIWASGGDFYNWTPNGNCPSCDTNIIRAIESTVYYVEVSDSAGCVSTDSVSVTVNPNPDGIVQNDTTICEGASVVLNTKGGNSYNWIANGNNSLPCTNCENPVATPEDSATYVVEMSNQFACTITDSVKVFVNPLPITHIVGPSDACLNETVNLQASGGVNYTWLENTSGLNCTNCDDPSFTAINDIEYVVEVESEFGCTAQDSITIIVRPSPDIQTIEDTRLCLGDEITLSSVSNTGVVFEWTQPKVLSADNILSPTANPEDDIQLIVTAYNQYDCQNSDTVNLEVIEKVIASPLNDTSICAGNVVQFNTNISAESYLGSTVSWSPLNYLSNISEHSVQSKPERSISYTRIIESGACIADTQKVNIKVNQIPDLKIEDPERSVNGGTITLNAVSSHFARNYEWGPYEALNCTNCENPEWYVDQDEQEFTLKFTDTEGCVAYDTVLVKSAGDCGDNFYIPNTFSPNKDEINDVLYVRGFGVSHLNYFRIFDRWGNMVFESKDVNHGWDGFYKGRMLSSDVFVYVMEGVCSNGQEVLKKGNVTLLR
ncbi:MAG: PKD domain-containing protein [Chitinophagales bacterium]